MTQTPATPTNYGEPPLVSYLHARGKRLGTPVSVTFELTSRCNFNCKMCYIHGDGCESELSVGQWLSLGEQARGAGALFLLLTGGEPLVRRDFAEIYTGLKNMGFIVSVNTNGSLISGKTAELFAKEPPHRLNVSLYGISDETYRAVTGVPAFEEVKKNLLHMHSIGVDCRLNCSLTPMNSGDITEIYKFAKGNNFFIKGTSYMYPPTRREGFVPGCGSFRFTADETAFFRKEINRLNLPPDVYKKRCEDLLKNGGGMLRECGEEADGGAPIACRAGSSSCWIDKDGFMSACGLFNTNKFNALTDGFDVAWDKVRKTTANIRLSAKCASCEKKQLCGVCAAAALAETGRFDGTPEYLCEVADRLYDCITAEAEGETHENK